MCFLCCRNLTPWLEREGPSWVADRNRESPSLGPWFATPRSFCWMRPHQPWTLRVKLRSRQPWIRSVDTKYLKDQQIETFWKFLPMLWESTLKNINIRANETLLWGFTDFSFLLGHMAEMGGPLSGLLWPKWSKLKSSPMQRATYVCFFLHVGHALIQSSCVKMYPKKSGYTLSSWETVKILALFCRQ